MTSSPKFYIYEEGVFTFKPKDHKLIYSNPHKVSLIITDGIDYPEYTFNITVIP
jgi:hypothetical protein